MSLGLIAGLICACSQPAPGPAARPSADAPQSHADSLKRSRDFFERGYSEYEPGHHDRALKLLDSAIAYNRENALAWQVKACCLAALDSFLAARAAFDTTLRIKPDYVRAWWHRGCLHASTGAVDTALADLRQAIAIDSSVKSWPFQDDCWKGMRRNPKLLALTGPPPDR
jgi:tetratricopeptide (TPR) repeat protein